MKDASYISANAQHALLPEQIEDKGMVKEMTKSRITHSKIPKDNGGFQSMK